MAPMVGEPDGVVADEHYSLTASNQENHALNSIPIQPVFVDIDNIVFNTYRKDFT